jgi:cytochrome c551/c552
VVGPSYKEVAQKYAGQPDAARASGARCRCRRIRR